MRKVIPTWKAIPKINLIAYPTKNLWHNTLGVRLYKCCAGIVQRPFVVAAAWILSTTEKLVYCVLPSKNFSSKPCAQLDTLCTKYNNNNALLLHRAVWTKSACNTRSARCFDAFMFYFESSILYCIWMRWSAHPFLDRWNYLKWNNQGTCTSQPHTHTHSTHTRTWWNALHARIHGSWINAEVHCAQRKKSTLSICYDVKNVNDNIASDATMHECACCSDSIGPLHRM